MLHNEINPVKVDYLNLHDFVFNDHLLKQHEQIQF